jgi:heterodisulfide reductase subunit C
MVIGRIVFIVILIAGFGFFGFNVKKVISNINLGRDKKINDRKGERWKVMTLVALGQKKMFQRPIPAMLHLFIYVAFLLTQIELIEIIIDGITGNHRVFYPSLGGLYTLVISIIEVLSVLALIATFAFLARRNLLKIPRFHKDEMTGWPKLDGNIILYLEILLVFFIFTMNGADEAVHIAEGKGSYGFALSQFYGPAFFGGIDIDSLHILERIGWWGHLVMVLTFMNYLPYSKHFHIFLAFPNVWYSNLDAKGRLSNMEAVTNEVKMMFDPEADPYAAPAEPVGEPQTFGVKDVTDLPWTGLLQAYTCTECGRCTSECPANQTGKLLSPRKIMMDTRDRMVELGDYKRKNGVDTHDGKKLVHDYISEEELWACTSCNACVEACPVNIDPLAIIVDLRRYLVMEESKAPAELTGMFSNIENNGAPWQFSPSDRLNWKDEQ